MRAESEGRSSGRNGRRDVTPARPAAPPLTLSEAAAYLNVSQRFMRRLVAERRIAFHKLGHLLRFRVTDLDRFLAAGRVEPAELHPLLRRLRG
jgi:excisionase family DNA binding protein